MASTAGPISGVGRGVGNQITPGDIVVSRIRGPFEAYVIGRIYAAMAGDRQFRYLDNAGSRESAIRKAYSHRTGEHQVWLFAGPDDDVYSKAPEPLP
jgi:hypothetical protein